ncbi:MAG: Gfo/Idh/MocA family oxidoreductase, partial [Caldilineaceae bacterium]|nr:Gfo/Idh/MocA family oxidoreductase [Caldilineaceae bacterium]
MRDKIGVGVMGGGGISAEGHICGYQADPRCEVVALYDLDEAKMKEQAQRLGVPHTYTDLDAFLQRDDIQAVSICSPDHLHGDHGHAALQAGKHVLCEKPMTMSYADTRLLIDTARQHQLLLMEGVWSRFQPNYRRLKELLKEGLIGEVKLVRADFGFDAGWQPERRLLNPDLAGGGTYDVGVYPIMFANDLFGGVPMDIQAMAEMTETGVDGHCSMLLRYPDGGVAQLNSGVQLRMRNDAIIYGKKGWIE